MSENEAKLLMAALAAPFAPGEVKFRPGATSGSRALALPYVDVRAIQDRLDEVLGLDGWQDQYTPLPDGSVVCELRCRIGGEWIVKTDVGSPSEQPDGGDRLKAAFSDALKRAAVKFGIGRYLYRLPSQWVDFDPAKKRFLHTPKLPQESPQAAKQGRKPTEAPSEAPAQSCAEGGGISESQWKLLADTLRARDIPAARLLAHFQVQKPRQLPASRFEEAFQLASAPESVLLGKAGVK
jgi:hypothetical protein